jgi:glycosyltransferase involved in cell wall biosynthesis
MAQQVTRYLPAIGDRCFVLYDGVATRDFDRRRPLSSRPTTAPPVLFVGGVSPRKGVHVLVDAFARVAPRLPGVELRIVGPPGEYDLAETFDLTDREQVRRIHSLYGGYPARLRASLGPDLASRVSFTGRISPTELLDHYLSASVFAFPSLWPEGFGLPPVEAMAAGVPVVASRIGALSETTVDGETGYLVEPGDSVGLADRIADLLTDEDRRTRMGRAAAERARRLFDWPVVASRLRAIYQQVPGRT